MYAIILGNGRAPDPVRLREHLDQADLFIAADGGASRARSLGLQPDLIIGDLDSYRPPESGAETAEVIHDPDQETNDLEKALSAAARRGAQRADIFGAFGHRPDHTLKNLSVLKRFNRTFRSLRFLDRWGMMLLLPNEFEIDVPTGSGISLIPLSGRVDGIQTKGLAYPLRDESLEMGVRDGTSNRAVGQRISISHRSGDLLLFIVDMEETE